ncbi:MAG TPA: spermidine synthase [Pseudolabrys sp.]|nr:spermidine synthase [Pseudolabrys sp.]
MLPWEKLDSAHIPGGAELRLMRRGTEFAIKLGSNELMSSRLTATEQALATLACDRIKTRPAPKILIGGLGMGFTLRAALTVLGPQAHIDVAELVPAVIAWARGPMASLFGASLADPRVAIHEADVVDMIRAPRVDYDAILLDVDNGPNGIVRKANDRLYDVNGLAAAHKALTAGGVLAVWSSAADAKFTGRLRKSGFAVTENAMRAKGPQGRAQHFIWVAVREG